MNEKSLFSRHCFRFCKPYLLFAIEGIKQLLEQRKPLAVILERPRGCDDIAKLINNGAVVLEF